MLHNKQFISLRTFTFKETSMTGKDSQVDEYPAMQMLLPMNLELYLWFYRSKRANEADLCDITNHKKVTKGLPFVDFMFE